MREEYIEDMDAYVTEFSSLGEFFDYVTKTPVNNVFSYSFDQKSKDGNEKFRGTATFEEACDLFKNGWSETTTNLVNRLKAIERTTKPTMKKKQVLAPCGYQAIVPLYLNNCPNNMINNKSVACKNKVITLNKQISYSAIVTKEEILRESVKAFLIIKKLEAIGYRVNLNVVCASLSRREGRRLICKIKVKNANEKLNVSKLAFPLVHPSMLRRFFIRFVEVTKNVTPGFRGGYGAPITNDNLKPFVNDGEYILPTFIKKDIESIKSLVDLNDL